MAPVPVEADVAVVGLGAMGSQALWRLALAGARVLGIEQFQPGHDRGSSHGETRIIRTAYAEGPAYVPLLRESWRLWAQLEAATGERLLRRTGGLMLGPPESETVAGAVASAEEHGLAYEMLDAAAIRARFPQHRVEGGIVGCYEDDAGVLFPERAVRAAVRAAVAAGATVFTGEPVTQILPDPWRPRLVLGGRTLSARHVVVAGGAWLPRLVPRLAGCLRVVRRVTGWFAADRPADFGPDRFPIFIRAMPGQAEPRTWYGVPQVDGRTVKLALHEWPGTDEPVDPAAGARPPDQRDARMISKVVAGGLGGLGQEPVRMSTCMYTMTPDRHFLVGQRADLPGLTLLAGFSGHGFKLSPALGQIAAGLALTGESPLPVALFDPHRFDRTGPEPMQPSSR